MMLVPPYVTFKQTFRWWRTFEGFWSVTIGLDSEANQLARMLLMLIYKLEFVTLNFDLQRSVHIVQWLSNLDLSYMTWLTSELLYLLHDFQYQL